jgi:hypothetical protein
MTTSSQVSDSVPLHRRGFGLGALPPMTIPTGDTRGPELMSMVSREEIDELFGIFFEHSELTRKSLCDLILMHSSVYPHVPMIYKEFHTPDLVLQRSQFLCTV